MEGVILVAFLGIFIDTIDTLYIDSVCKDLCLKQIWLFQIQHGDSYDVSNFKPLSSNISLSI
jgi:hypothetical protein